MGKLNQDPYINHFSHPHPLEIELFNPQSLYITSCSACNLQASGWIYSCKPCNFTLHMSCTQMAELITHPAHPIHPLTLFPSPAYPGGSFNCDACGRQGSGFNYHCTTCDFDVHMMCATNPLSVAHPSHLHQLNLAFYPPYQTKGFSCDICHKIGSNHWLYRCSACEFDAHMECAVNTALPLPHLQHTNSLPAANNVNAQYYQHQAGRRGFSTVYRHSQSMGTMPIQQQQVGYPQLNGGPNGATIRSQSMGAMPVSQQQASYQQPNGGPNGSGNGTLVDTMVQGLVDGAAQQVGQMFVQSIINSDGGNGDPNGASGSNSSTPSIISIGSSILSGMFSGDSDN